MRKRFALFIGELYMDYQTKLYCGIEKAAIENDVYIDIFSNYGVFSKNYLHTIGEVNVKNIPDFSKYDGIMVAPDTLTVPGMFEEIDFLIKEKANCPIMSVRTQEDNYYNILVDDRTSMEQIIEHFVTVHGCKKICYMSGRADMLDARRRLAGYKAVMERHNLPILDNMIFQGDYWTGKGRAAVETFYSNGFKPDAIVCANDYMAISVYHALKEKGINVPDDVLLSGYDNINEAFFINPPLATVETPSFEMGYKALDSLVKLSNGEIVAKEQPISATLFLEGSCGCKSCMREGVSEKLYNSFMDLRDAVHTSLVLSAEYESCNTVEEVLKTAHKNSLEIAYKDLYVCLCDNYEGSEEYTEIGEYTPNMRLVASFNKEKDEFITLKETFERSEILPDKYRKDLLLSVFPLHFRGHCLGYIAMTFDDIKKLQLGFVIWSNSLANYLDKINMYEKNKELMQYRVEINMDNLTGIYNRRGMDLALLKATQELEEERTGLFVISADMDGLKIINDTYGHAEGDVAIKTIGMILSGFSSPNIFSARTGGDEFIIGVKGSENDVKKAINTIRKKVKRFNDTASKPYKLSVSIGYERFDQNIGLVECLRRADEKMYEEKKTKKECRN
jgi:diguanylate cyclase (GGDEF)-like protein